MSTDELEDAPQRVEEPLTRFHTDNSLTRLVCGSLFLAGTKSRASLVRREYDAMIREKDLLLFSYCDMQGKTRFRLV